MEEDFKKCESKPYVEDEENSHILFVNELDDFKSIPTSLVYDNTLSDRARFVYIYMALKPSGWKFYSKRMAKEIGYNIDTLRKYINELVDSGWLIREAQKNENGVFGTVRYTVPSMKNTVTEIFRDGKNHERLIYNKYNTNIGYNAYDNIGTTNKESNTNVLPKKVDYQAIFDCWNKFNGKKLGNVTQFTEKRKKAIKAQLAAHKISADKLMQFFSTLPFADKWLYNPSNNHKTWKPTFDWWMANTNNWLTKGLEGGVHMENPQAFKSIMDGKEFSEVLPYTPSGHNVYYDELRGFYYYTGFYMRSNDIMDGYTDEERPDGAKLCLNNARGVIRWNAETKKWEKIW